MTVNHVITLSNWFWPLQKRTPLRRDANSYVKCVSLTHFCLASAKIWLSHTKFTKQPRIFPVNYRILPSIIRTSPYTTNLMQCGEKSLIFSWPLTISRPISQWHHIQTLPYTSVYLRNVGSQKCTKVIERKALIVSLLTNASDYSSETTIFVRSGVHNGSDGKR